LIGLLGTGLLVKSLFNLPSLITNITKLMGNIKQIKALPPLLKAMEKGWTKPQIRSGFAGKAAKTALASKDAWRNISPKVAGVSILGGLTAGFLTFAADRKRTDLDSKEKSGRAIGAGMGATALGMLGAVIGGPLGMMIGQVVGAEVGKFLGQVMSGGKLTKQIANGLWKTIFWVEDGFKSIFTSIGNFFSGIFNNIKNGFDSVINSIADFILSIFNGVKDAFNKIIGSIYGLFVNLMILVDKATLGAGVSN